MRKSLPPNQSADDWQPDADELALAEAYEREAAAAVDRVMSSDDRLSAAHAEIKRQAAEIAALRASRDSFMAKCDEAVRRVKGLRRELDRLRGLQ